VRKATQPARLTLLVAATNGLLPHLPDPGVVIQVPLAELRQQVPRLAIHQRNDARQGARQLQGTHTCGQQKEVKQSQATSHLDQNP
jgi:hypothetical protein